MMKKYQHQFAAPIRRRTQDHEMRAAFKVAAQPTEHAEHSTH